jgi:hypothetical protein
MGARFFDPVHEADTSLVLGDPVRERAEDTHGMHGLVGVKRQNNEL